MSGMMTSTPSSSSSGNMMPASTTMMEPPERKSIMCMPNSPSPPSGITSELDPISRPTNGLDRLNSAITSANRCFLDLALDDDMDSHRHVKPLTGSSFRQTSL